MALIVADCPRCRSKHITMDVSSAVHVGSSYNWQQHYELFCNCRHCHHPSIFLVSQEESRDENLFVNAATLVAFKTSLNPHIRIKGPITLKDTAAQPTPEHVVGEIAAAFSEGAKCLAIGCPNAAAAMFRACVDLATRPLLPEGEVEGLNKKTRRDLGLRLPWLFANQLLDRSLEELSTAIREDGNDGVHAANLSNEDAEDLLDFTTALLQRLITEPAKLKLAASRREVRRQPKT